MGGVGAGETILPRFGVGVCPSGLQGGPPPRSFPSGRPGWGCSWLPPRGATPPPPRGATPPPPRGADPPLGFSPHRTPVQPREVRGGCASRAPAQNLHGYPRPFSSSREDIKIPPAVTLPGLFGRGSFPEGTACPQLRAPDPGGERSPPCRRPPGWWQDARRVPGRWQPDWPLPGRLYPSDRNSPEGPILPPLRPAVPAGAAPGTGRDRISGRGGSRKFGQASGECRGVRVASLSQLPQRRC